MERELVRWQETTIFRLRTGHCRLLSLIPYRLMLSHTDNCPCGTGVQVPRTHPSKLPSPHTLERTRRLWSSGADFWDKLWGSKEELLTATQFTKIIHLLMWHDHTNIRTQKKKTKMVACLFCDTSSPPPSTLPPSFPHVSVGGWSDIQGPFQQGGLCCRDDLFHLWWYCGTVAAHASLRFT